MKKSPPLLEKDCLSCSVRGGDCFCNLTEQSLLNLQHIGTSRRLEAGETVVREGSLADHVFVVCHGRIKLTTSSSDGRLMILRIAGPGDVLGLAAALKDSCHKLSAEAMEPCEVKAIGRVEFLEFMERFRDASRSAATSVASDYEGAILSARRLALSGSAGAKLASALLEWARAGAHVGGKDDTLAFVMPLTHEELGNLAGISRETVTRLLGRFRREGLLEQRGEQMVLLEPKKLEALSD